MKGQINFINLRLYFLVVFLSDDAKENITKYFQIIHSNIHGVWGSRNILVTGHSLVKQYTLYDHKAKDKIKDKSNVF
jgi:hypothetical protein